LAEVSEDALAQAVSKRLRDFTELKTKVQALELAMAVVRILTPRSGRVFIASRSGFQGRDDARSREWVCLGTRVDHVVGGVVQLKVAEENRALKQKLADKDRECVELQREVGEVQMKMAEIITNITHLNDASVAERSSASAASQRKPQF
jgi:hypothetical protein